MREIMIAPSVLSADMLNLGKDIKKCEEYGVDMLHIDVMDGVYVPNMSFGFDVIKAISAATHLVRDVHMMTSCVDKYIDRLSECGASSVTIHENTCVLGTTEDALKKIKSLGMKSGIAIKPGEGAEIAEKYMHLCDTVLVMTVEPGFGGQSFMSHMTDKIARIRKNADDNGYDIDIQVDGGINAKNAAICAEYGANVFVAGTSLFKAEDMHKASEEMRNFARDAYLTKI